MKGLSGRLKYTAGSHVSDLNKLCSIHRGRDRRIVFEKKMADLTLCNADFNTDTHF